MKARTVFVAAASVVAVGGFGLLVAKKDHLVGDVTPEGVVTPTGRAVKTDGLTLDLKQSVVDTVLTADGKQAIVKTADAVHLIDISTGKQLSSAAITGGASLTGVALSPDGTTVVASNADSLVQVYKLEDDKLTKQGQIRLAQAKAGGVSYPCGVVFLDNHRLAIAANRDNALVIANLETLKVTQRIPVDTAPYSLLLTDPNHILVTCWAAPNQSGQPTAPSAGTDVQVDKRGIGVGGTLCQVDLQANTVSQRTTLGLQPTEMLMANGRLFIACANADAVYQLDAKTLKVQTKLTAGKLSGSAPQSLALDKDKKTLYVAFGGLDRIGAYDLQRQRWNGFMLTDWYPSSVRWTPGGLLVGTAKGIGSRENKTSKKNVYDVTSSFSCIAHPLFNAPLPPEPLDGPARTDVAAVPIPERSGEPSLIKHVVYVIKENRTYDQILGDMKEGNGDADLTMYGEKITPNQHAIARNFALLDNYYCNGILSADGHAWATEANATSYYEHTRGGWTRSYPFGDDPLATSTSGYIWDDALDHGKTVRNFGEFDYATPIGKSGAFDILKQFQTGEHQKFKQNLGVARIRDVSEPDFPGWNLAIPDVLRADRFAKRLKELEASGDMADLTIVYLPQDHTSGGSGGFPTPRAQVADNDQGVGKVVEALSHSKFWKDSVIFVTEDDPQAGFDHVDGHRSACLIAGPYVKRHQTISRFYNQAAVLRTIERILGLPPLNINDAEANVMTDCFVSTPDLTPYDNLEPQIPLDEKGQTTSLVFNLAEPDNVDDNKFNRELWRLSGKKAPYPEKYTVKLPKGKDKDDD